jgi:hemolysin activation/secretion protein
MDLQVTNGPLFPLEQVSLGGRFSVRGYREVTLLADNAFLASLETRFPIIRWASGEPMVQFAQFVDVGHGWNRGANRQFFDSSGLPQTIAGVGVGLRWTVLPRNRATFEVYWGQKLNHTPRVGDALQDYGVHVSLAVNVL